MTNSVSTLASLSDASWLIDRFPPADSGFGAGLLGIVPEGFSRYIRILHPASKSRPKGMEWGEFFRLNNAGRFDELPEILDEAVRWAEIADMFQKTFHPLVQSRALLFDEVDPEDQLSISPDGWMIDLPPEGNIPVETFQHLMGTLTSVTCSEKTHADSLFAAIWEGWGGLTSGAGKAALFGFGTPTPYMCRTKYQVHRLRMFLSRRLSAFRFQNGPKPGTGLLSAEEANAERLELPHRSYILFSVPKDLFTDPSWPQQVSWSEENWPQTPTLIWPEDHSWVMVSEIDFDSTIIACGDTLAKTLLTDSKLEAVEISFDADLSWHGDTLNPYKN